MCRGSLGSGSTLRPNGKDIIIIIIIIIIILLSSSQLFNFNRAESSALRPTPNLEGQGISLSLVS